MPRVRSRKRRRLRNTNVFINVPFDRAYEPCYVALIAGLVAAGLTPASSLEYAADRDRLELVFRRLQRCGVSLHDFSRQRGRLNMPFEAGLAKALQLSGRHHSAYFLEAVPRRLLRTLSDAKQDAYIHHGRPLGVLRLVGSIFGRPSAPLRLTQLRRVHKLVRRSVPSIRRKWRTLFDRAAFGELVFAAKQAAREATLQSLR